MRRVPGLQMAWHCFQEYDWLSPYCTTHTVLYTNPYELSQLREEDGGRGESVENMQRLKWGRE